MSRPNPYQRDGGWWFEVGPFANERDALHDLLSRAGAYEQQRADDADQADQPEPPPPPISNNVIAFKPRAQQ